MPICTLKLLHDDPPGILPPSAVQALADALGALFGADPGTTWLTVEYVSREHYAENGAAVGLAVRPAMLEVLKYQLPDRDTLAQEADGLATVVAAHTGRPRENVHVLYLPPGKDRIAFGGHLR